MSWRVGNSDVQIVESRFFKRAISNSKTRRSEEKYGNDKGKVAQGVILSTGGQPVVKDDLLMVYEPPAGKKRKKR